MVNIFVYLGMRGIKKANYFSYLYILIIVFLQITNYNLQITNTLNEQLTNPDKHRGLQ